MTSSKFKLSTLTLLTAAALAGAGSGIADAQNATTTPTGSADLGSSAPGGFLYSPFFDAFESSPSGQLIFGNGSSLINDATLSAFGPGLLLCEASGQGAGPSGCTMI